MYKNQNVELLQEVAFSVQSGVAGKGKMEGDSSERLKTALRFGNLEGARSQEGAEAKSKRLHQEALARLFTALRNNNPSVWQYFLRRLFGHDAIDKHGHIKEHRKLPHRHHDAVPAQNVSKAVNPLIIQVELSFHQELTHYVDNVTRASQVANSKTKEILSEYWELPPHLENIITNVPPNAATHEAMIDAAIDNHEFDGLQLAFLLGGDRPTHAPTPTTTPKFESVIHHTQSREDAARHIIRAQIKNLKQDLVTTAFSMRLHYSPSAPREEEDQYYYEYVRAGIERHARAFATAAVLQGAHNIHMPVPTWKTNAPGSLFEAFLRVMNEARLEQLHVAYGAERQMGNNFRQGLFSLPNTFNAIEENVASEEAVRSVIEAIAPNALRRMIANAAPRPTA